MNTLKYIHGISANYFKVRQEKYGKIPVSFLFSYNNAHGIQKYTIGLESSGTAML